MPEIRFGEHRQEDFLNADIVVYSSAVPPDLLQLRMAREANKEVYSEFALGNQLCDKPIIAVCGHHGRTTVAHMVGFTLKLEGKNVFIGGTSESPFIEFSMLPNKNEVDYVIIEVSAIQMRHVDNFRPGIVVFTSIAEDYPQNQFQSVGDYMDTKLSIVKSLAPDDIMVVNFDKLNSNPSFKNASCRAYWYSRRSFINMNVVNEVQGTHFHNRRIHSNINYHSEFKVNNMRIVGSRNRENLLAAITVCKTLNVSDKSIQKCVEHFPGIPHRLEFLMEKNGVSFYNNSKATSMAHLLESLDAFKQPVILIAGGKDTEEFDYGTYSNNVVKNCRILVLVGENKERLNRTLGLHEQTFIVGSFEESILLAYQKSRTGDVIVLSPGAPATDFFRDFEERGNYYKKLVYQL